MPRKKPNVIILDVETRQGFRKKPDVFQFGMSVGGTYSYRLRQYDFFYEDDMDGLIDVLDEADIVVGYNLYRYDYCVLAGECNNKSNVFRLPTFDIMQHVFTMTGYRVTMNNIYKHTYELPHNKKKEDVKAIDLYEQDRMDELEDYLKHDLWITQQIFNHGCKLGHLKYFNVKTQAVHDVDTKHWADLCKSICKMNWKP